MRQSDFTAKHEKLWQDYASWLDYQQAAAYDKKKMTRPELDLPHAYRQICHHLSLAQSRMYSPVLIDYLNQLVTRGHQYLYSRREPMLSHIMRFLLGGFAALVRKEWRLLLVSSSLFYLPFLFFLVGAQIKPELVYTMVDPSSLRDMEAMYDPELKERYGREREADTDLLMFGFYIKNNTGIGFQTFAGGLLLGIGTLFFLVFNGLFIGAIAGHLTQLGYISTFWGFVSGHSAMELTAIVISGLAGLKLAMALIAPGRKTRFRALRDNGKVAVKIMYGAALMFILAAFIEAFWSSHAMIPVTVKYAFGLMMWVLVISYFVFAGRSVNSDAISEKGMN